MGRAWNYTLRRTPHLLQLRHQACLGVETTRCVDNDVVRLTCAGRLQRIKQHSRWIAPCASSNDLCARALSPDFQLFNGGSAKSISRSQQNSFSLGTEVLR